MSDARLAFIESMRGYTDRELLDLFSRITIQRHLQGAAEAEDNEDMLRIIRTEIMSRMEESK